MQIKKSRKGLHDNVMARLPLNILDALKVVDIHLDVGLSKVQIVLDLLLIYISLPEDVQERLAGMDLIGDTRETPSSWKTVRRRRVRRIRSLLRQQNVREGKRRSRRFLQALKILCSVVLA